jgi:plastocyanin
MKTNFTLGKQIKKVPLLLLIVISTSMLTAQTTHNITVSDFSFSPSSLTIEAGDTVVWTNTGGSHNVNGQTSTFSSNPASFGNNVGTGWTYKFTFTVVGTYSYQCNPHAPGMAGTITVNQTATAIGDTELADMELLVYPNPASEQIYISAKDILSENTLLTFYNSLGSKIHIQPVSAESNIVMYDVQHLNKGLYLVQVQNQKYNKVVKFIKQ